MQESDKQSVLIIERKLKEFFCTVTPVSKYLALFSFIMLPVFGFYYGLYYSATAQPHAQLSVIAKIPQEAYSASTLEGLGVVLRNHSENRVVGSYLEVDVFGNEDDLYIVYSPFLLDEKIPCENEITHTFNTGDTIEFKAEKIFEWGGVQLQLNVATPCSSDVYYIKSVD